MHAAPWSRPVKGDASHASGGASLTQGSFAGRSLQTAGSTVITGSTKFVPAHASLDLSSRHVGASIDGASMTGSLGSFLTKPRGLLVGRGEGDQINAGGGLNAVLATGRMRNLRGGANVMHPRRDKLLDNLKQRSFMLSQSHKPDARRVGSRMKAEWETLLTPNGLARTVQLWAVSDDFQQAQRSARGQVTVRRNAQRGLVAAARRNSRSTKMVHAYDREAADGDPEPDDDDSSLSNSLTSEWDLPPGFTLENFLREPRNSFSAPAALDTTSTNPLERVTPGSTRILQMAAEIDLGEMLPEFTSPFPVTSTLDFEGRDPRWNQPLV